MDNSHNLNPDIIEGIVFDLDGTLYEDEKHFDYYAKCLAGKLPQEKGEAFFCDLKAARRGDHPLRLGRVYDVKNDYILDINEKGEVLRARDWQGNMLSDEAREKIYSKPVTCDLKEMIFVGDGWWIPAACAYHYGLEDTTECYRKTKDWLADNQEEVLSQIPGLKSFLKQIKHEYTLILATNSEAHDTERLLEILELTGVFQEKYTDCRKPEKSRQIFKHIMSKYDHGPKELLSIGDNFLNDIAPAERLGYQTLLIDPHQIYDDPGVPRVSSLREIYPLFDYDA